MSSGKQLVKGKSGLRMLAVSEDERCPFLLEEPHWTDDSQVWCFSSFPCIFLGLKVFRVVVLIHSSLQYHVPNICLLFRFAVSKLCKVQSKIRLHSSQGNVLLSKSVLF